MKLIHRTSYWGANIKGMVDAPRPASFHNNKPCRTIFAQVDFQDEVYGESGHSGLSRSACCPHVWGNREFELTERHFLDAHNGAWNIYWMRSRQQHRRGPTEGATIHEFFVAPDNQTSFHAGHVVAQDGWELWGTLHASILRMDLEPLLRSFARENKQCGRYAQHAHLFVLMDVAIDIAPPEPSNKSRQSKRLLPKQRRALRDAQNIVHNFKPKLEAPHHKEAQKTNRD